MKTKRVRACFLSAVMILLLGFTRLHAQVLKTPAEESRYTRYSQHEDMARFLSALDFLSPEAVVLVIGKTRQVREFDAKDLFLVIISEEGAGSPDRLNRAKPTIFLTASQHGNEQSAKEAALWIIRDIAVGELKPLLKKANFLLIPQSNPYGNQFDRRQNEQDLDLNRDHVKLESEEVRAIHRVFRQWTPEVTMDVHEKGDDYYRVSIGCVSNANISARLQEFSREELLAAVERNLEKKRISFHEYLVSQEIGLDSSAGVRYRPEELAGREEMMRYSTSDLNDGRNSLGIYATLSFIQEGASRHDLETLEQRTRWQYFGIRFFAEAVADQGTEILALVGKMRADLMARARGYAEDNLAHLQMGYVRDERQPTLTIKKFVRIESPIRGILKVDKKAGEALTAADVSPYPFPPEQKVVTEVVKNWFPGVAPTVSVPRPLGYMIPAGHQDIVENLLDHGILVESFTRDMPLEVEGYAAGEIIPAKYDYLPPEKIVVEKRAFSIVAKKGDYYVNCAQPGANLIPCLLEPQSQYGLIRYWTFNLVPEAGNIYAIYRVVKPVALPLIPYRNW